MWSSDLKINKISHCSKVPNVERNLYSKHLKNHQYIINRNILCIESSKNPISMDLWALKNHLGDARKDGTPNRPGGEGSPGQNLKESGVWPKRCSPTSLPYHPPCEYSASTCCPWKSPPKHHFISVLVLTSPLDVSPGGNRSQLPDSLESSVCNEVLQGVHDWSFGQLIICPWSQTPHEMRCFGPKP